MNESKIADQVCTLSSLSYARSTYSRGQTDQCVNKTNVPPLAQAIIRIGLISGLTENKDNGHFQKSLLLVGFSDLGKGWCLLRSTTSTSTRGCTLLLGCLLAYWLKKKDPSGQFRVRIGDTRHTFHESKNGIKLPSRTFNRAEEIVTRGGSKSRQGRDGEPAGALARRRGCGGGSLVLSRPLDRACAEETTAVGLRGHDKGAAESSRGCGRGANRSKHDEVVLMVDGENSEKEISFETPVEIHIEPNYTHSDHMHCFFGVGL